MKHNISPYIGVLIMAAVVMSSVAQAANSEAIAQACKRMLVQNSGGGENPSVEKLVVVESQLGSGLSSFVRYGRDEPGLAIQPVIEEVLEGRTRSVSAQMVHDVEGLTLHRAQIRVKRLHPDRLMGQNIASENPIFFELHPEAHKTLVNNRISEGSDITILTGQELVGIGLTAFERNLLEDHTLGPNMGKVDQRTVRIEGVGENIVKLRTLNYGLQADKESRAIQVRVTQKLANRVRQIKREADGRQVDAIVSVVLADVLVAAFTPDAFDSERKFSHGARLMYFRQ